LTSIPVQTYVRDVSEETAKKPVNTTVVDLTGEENPWVSDAMHVDRIEIESDGDVDDVDEYPDYYPYDYDTEDKDSVNGDTHAEPIQVYVPPVYPLVMINRRLWRLKRRTWINPNATTVECPRLIFKPRHPCF
jgi:hypothetical protein